jgi:hypothetical protein
MSLVKRLFLPLVGAGLLAFGVASCSNPNGPEKPEEPVTEQPATEEPGTTTPTTPVDPAIINDYAPVITSIPNPPVNEGETYNYQMVVTDADGNPLTYSKTKGPAEASISATGLISYPTSLIDADVVEQMGFQVSDGKNVTPQEFNVRVKDLETRAAIIGSADRLIILQNTNGSWDWDVTNKTGPTSKTYLNIAGVAADGLLAAYDVTGEAKYLDGAKRAGNFIITEINKLPEARHFNAFNMKFLKDLAQASGDATYSNYVAKKMDDLKTKVTYFERDGVQTNINTDGQLGLSAAELVAAESIIRSDPLDGDNPWDLLYFVKLAKEAGDISYATAVANGIKNHLDKSGFNDTANSHIMGLSAGIMALKEAGINYTSYLEKLVAEQNSDGRFETPYKDYGTSKVTATAFALMALKEAGHPGASAAVKYLANSIGYGSGTKGWLEGDSLEYSEPNGEAGKALGLFIK